METRVVHSTNEFFSATNKGCTTYSPEKQHDLSLLMHCDSRYVGCTSQRLQSRIEPHVSKPICSLSSSHKRLFSVSRFKSSIQTNTQFFASDSATRLHFLPNLACAQHYYDSRLFFLAQGLSPFHLSAFEANFIKTSYPALRRQKEFL